MPTVIVLIICGLTYFLVIAPMITQAKVVQNQVEVLKAAAKDQNLTTLRDELPKLQHELDALQQQSEQLGLISYLPVIGHYYNDSQHAFAAAHEGIEGGQILLDALEPYAPVLGFKSQASAAIVDKPNDQRVAELVLLMPAILPALDQATTNFAQANYEMSQIQTDRYPQQIPFTTFNVRQQLSQIKQQINGLNQGIIQARPVLEILPSVLGADEPKRYLLIFQNDKELRPTGGFMTSTAYITFNNGKFEVTESNDIYELDHNESYLPVPIPMRLYNAATKYYMRDTNWSPDFAKSMETFEYYYSRGNHPAIDGYITLDTQFVEDLMKVTGPIDVPGYGEFSAEPIEVNGAKVSKVVYELEIIAQKSGLNQDNRKSVIGDLMKELINKLFSEPVTKWPEYLDLVLKMGQEKHVLLNFHNPKAQALAEDNNFAGQITASQAPVDYLHINDANLAGLKTNFYLKQATTQDITVANDGTVTKKLTITYTNTGTFDGWISATARNYTRVYVPLGSKLVASTGGEQKVDVMEELGKTVFDNFVLVKPKQSKTITFTYELPFKIDGRYQELIQKQPGAQNWLYTTNLNGQKHETTIDGDKQIDLEIK